ncbi:MAG: hypothetical protein FVQ83_06520 [Chloroflexi bacterium]|nr:hypothetical protein [Chloroflexota bacterium]
MKKTGLQDPARQALVIVFGATILYIFLTVRLGGISAVDIIYAMYFAASFQFEFISPNVRAIVFDIVVIMIGGTIFWLSFLGQFVLPVQSLDERKKVIQRLIGTLGVQPGPALFIRNGEIIEDPKKKNRKGAGVTILDTASAAVLHNQSSYTRAIGPGLVFTKKNEATARAIDLHTQVRRLGHKSPDEDPFAERGENESEEEFNFRQSRRLQTSGLTRDGVEVVPNITTVFRLISSKSEGSTQFGYNHDSVWQAVSYEAIVPEVSKEESRRNEAWDRLPVFVATDLWREYLRKFTLNQLFGFEDHEASVDDKGKSIPVIEFIIKKVNERLKNALFNEIDEVGLPTNRRISSLEFQKMRQRGIQIINAGISNLRFDSSIETMLISRWNAKWLDYAKGFQKTVKGRQSNAKLIGEISAQREFADNVSPILYDRIKDWQWGQTAKITLLESVESLIRGTLDGITLNPKLKTALEDEEAGLLDLIEWLHK